MIIYYEHFTCYFHIINTVKYYVNRIYIRQVKLTSLYFMRKDMKKLNEYYVFTIIVSYSGTGKSESCIKQYLNIKNKETHYFDNFSNLTDI